MNPAFAFAERLLTSGLSYQATAMSTGISEPLLRSTMARTVTRPTFTSPDSTIQFGPPTPTRKQLIRYLIASIARKHGRTYADLVSPPHCRSFAWPRHEAMYEVRHQFGLSYPRLGQMFNRDHSTVLDGVARQAERMAWAQFLMWAATP